jgi:hypothetical protein
MTASSSAAPGILGERPAPAGLPDPRIQPPVIAESGDPFAVVRVIDLVARLDRGVPIRLDDVVDRLNAAWTDWLFTRVVVDALVALQANWMADYRNASGIVIEEGPTGPRSRSRTRAASTHGSSGPSAPPPSAARPDEFARRDRRRRVVEMRRLDALDLDPAGRCACPWRARSR